MKLPIPCQVLFVLAVGFVGCSKKEDAAPTTSTGEEEGATEGVGSGDQPGGSTGGGTGGTTGGTTGTTDLPTPAPAVITASVTAQNFGSMPINWGQASNVVTFTAEAGKATATAIAGNALAAPFEYLSEPFPGYLQNGEGCGTTLAAGASCKVNLAFGPTAVGPFTGNFVFSYFDGKETKSITIPLSGTGMAPGSVNSSFGTNGEATAHDPSVIYHKVEAMAYDWYGGVLAAGSRMAPDYSASGMVVRRYNADGTADSSFNGGAGEFTTQGSGCVMISVVGMRFLPSGKTMIGYHCNAGGFQYYQGALRLNADGTLDTTYGTAGYFQNDGGHGQSAGVKAYFADSGAATLIGQDMAVLVVKATAAGVLDTSYNGTGSSYTNISAASNPWGYALDETGELYVGTQHGMVGAMDAKIAKLKADGTGVDTTWAVNGYRTIDLGAANDRFDSLDIGYGAKLYAAALSDNKLKVMRFALASGAVDTTYGTAGVATMDLGIANDWHVIPNQLDVSTGRAIVSGYVGPQNSDHRKLFVARFLYDGVPDADFGAAGSYLTQVGGENSASYSLLVSYFGNFLLGGMAGPGDPSDWAILSFWQ